MRSSDELPADPPPAPGRNPDAPEPPTAEPAAAPHADGLAGLPGDAGALDVAGPVTTNPAAVAGGAGPTDGVDGAGSVVGAGADDGVRAEAGEPGDGQDAVLAPAAEAALADVPANAPARLVAGAVAADADAGEPARESEGRGRLRRLVALVGRRAGRPRATGQIRPRWLTAIIVALAIAVPGGATVGTTMTMMGREPDPDSSLDGRLEFQEEPAALDAFMEPELLEAVPVGAEPVAEPVRAVLSSSRVIEQLGQSDIPEVALRAYTQAADRLAEDDPDCGIRWTLLAAIGRVESDHGRFGGAELREDGYGTRPIRGIPLDGRENVALITDTDDAALDGDETYDRAVGPMQFIPSTWRSVGVDANDDGRRDPNNIFDAAQGAAVYLCSGGGNLREMADQARAVRQYNNADEYVRVVLSLARMYETGRVEPLPSLPGLGGPVGSGSGSAGGSGSGSGSGFDPGSGSAGGPVGSDFDSGSGSAGGSGSGSGSGSAGGSGSGSGSGGGPGLGSDPGSGSGGSPAPAPAPRPNPRPGSGGTPPPRPTTSTTAPAPRPGPTTTTTTAPPQPQPTTTTTTTTAPQPTTTTVPETTTTTVPESTTTTAPPAPEPPDTAAVGWAPAMRQVVVQVLEDEPDPAPTATTARPAPAPPAPTTTTVPPPAAATTPSAAAPATDPASATPTAPPA